jgi:hypothetical protein
MDISAPRSGQRRLHENEEEGIMRANGLKAAAPPISHWRIVKTARAA